ncbi:hypothetical protein HPB48_015451 [Haemaphysalis longicornis]|uniref:CCHC-type domain-containing protein n=1 Tax=Haemaphysalis longicornis TaxID=44386 RepID=A0A9J6GIZ1_HAELO|nr:hypothetical protein HPB48_015451 [Haemaphysalis longicornis]
MTRARDEARIVNGATQDIDAELTCVVSSLNEFVFRLEFTSYRPKISWTIFGSLQDSLDINNTQAGGQRWVVGAMTTATGYDPDTMQVVEIQTSPTNQPVLEEFTEYVMKKKIERQQERLQQEQLRQDGVTTGTQRAGNADRRLQTPRSASWKPAFMRKLGREDSVVVIKPRDTINLAAYKGTNKLKAAISTATGIPLASHELTICALIINGVRREVEAHLKPAEDTCRVVINVDPAVTEQDISGVTYSPEAQILNIRKLGETNVAVLTFEERQVPCHIFYWNEAISVRLYRKITPACPRCGAVGHRADVCPTPNTQQCQACGEAQPGLEHNCPPTCLICGDSNLNIGDQGQCATVAPRKAPTREALVTTRPQAWNDSYSINEKGDEEDPGTRAEGTPKQQRTRQQRITQS